MQGDVLQFKDSIYNSKVKRPRLTVVRGTALEILPAHTPKDMIANWMQSCIHDKLMSSHPGCRWVELNWRVCLRGCQHITDTSRGLEPGDQIFVQRLVQWAVLKIPIWSASLIRQKKGHQIYGSQWIQRLTWHWVSQPLKDLWEHGLSFLVATLTLPGQKWIF